jgi:hypothetical protein
MTYLIILETTEEMLCPLVEVVRREDIDDTQVVDCIFVFVPLVCCPQAALVLVEDEMPPL